MMFQFPKHQINSVIWFLGEKDQLVFGMVDLITIAIKEDKVGIWYGVIDEHNKQHTVNENQVLDNRTQMNQPKYSMGDEVSYEYKDADGRIHFTTGIVDCIKMFIEHDKQYIQYYMDDDQDYPVDQGDVLGMADPMLNEMTGQ